jgi:hypothetical protein
VRGSARRGADVGGVTAGSPCTTWCSRCRAAAAGMTGGPYTPAEFTGLAVERPASPVATHPAVIGAAAARDEARALFDVLDSVWLTALAEHSRADLAGDGDSSIRRRLGEAAAAGREARDAAWSRVVTANEALHTATREARRAVEANR